MKCKWWVFTDMQMAKKKIITEKKYNCSYANIWAACSESGASQSRKSH